jgi:hypothetical protein
MAVLSVDDILLNERGELVPNRVFGLADDEGFIEALDNEFIGQLVQERLADYDPASSVSLDALIIELGFDPAELRVEAGIEYSRENIGALDSREIMLASMDDGSGSLIPPRTAPTATLADSLSLAKENGR